MYSNNVFEINGIATSAITDYTIVQRDPANDNNIIQGTLNCRAIGVGPTYAVGAGVACLVQVAGVGQIRLGEDVVRGETLISNAVGAAVSTQSQAGDSNFSVVGIAIQSGIAGSVIPVQITIYDSTVGTNAGSSSSSSAT